MANLGLSAVLYVIIDICSELDMVLTCKVSC